jgi:hypothetical protein
MTTVLHSGLAAFRSEAISERISHLRLRRTRFFPSPCLSEGLNNSYSKLKPPGFAGFTIFLVEFSLEQLDGDRQS